MLTKTLKNFGKVTGSIFKLKSCSSIMDRQLTKNPNKNPKQNTNDGGEEN